jgi:hypothetical protein
MCQYAFWFYGDQKENQERRGKRSLTTYWLENICQHPCEGNLIYTEELWNI